MREELGAGEQVWLEDHTNGRIGVPASGRIQQGRDFGGMVGVIVHYSDLLDRAAHLEAACRTEELPAALAASAGLTPSSTAALMAAAALRALCTPGTFRATL